MNSTDQNPDPNALNIELSETMAKAAEEAVRAGRREVSTQE